MVRGGFERCGAVLVAVALAGCARSTGSVQPPPPVAASLRGEAATVRYVVGDVDRAVDFYTRRLGFDAEKRTGTVFAIVSHGALRLLLSGPGSTGARPLADGRRQAPGGWNRIVLYVDDLETHVRTLERAGVRVRSPVETVPGGKQVQIEDPDGNPIELHETTPIEAPAEDRPRRRGNPRHP